MFIKDLDPYDIRSSLVSLEFFEDIYVPVYALPSPSEAEPLDSEVGNEKPGDLEEHGKETPSNPKESQKGKLRKVRWVWNYNDEKFYIDDDLEIRFQVAGVSYPPIPLEQEEGSKPFAPMVVTGAIDSDGLGPVAWWS